MNQSINYRIRYRFVRNTSSRTEITRHGKIEKDCDGNDDPQKIKKLRATAPP